MKVFGQPKYLNLYYRYFVPLLKRIDLTKWDIDVYLLPTEEMPPGMQGTRVKFTPPKSVYIPMVDLPDLEDDTYMRALVPSIAHEFGHYGHENFMGEDGSDKWYEFADLTGVILDFNWKTVEYGKGRQPYTYIPAYEEFADHFKDWLMGRIVGRKFNKFYYSLWGQEYMTKIELWIGNNEYTIDGEVFKMDVAPEIKNSRTMVPVRFIAEAFDKDVFWNEKERKVVIKDK